MIGQMGFQKDMARYVSYVVVWGWLDSPAKRGFCLLLRHCTALRCSTQPRRRRTRIHHDSRPASTY
ncbi:hypothetical protein PVAG01_06706 [Phlyctema vagabunda]|uniref:Uncharacterized protein n=1 Tax=Phlyctema vagabunda TaxID=108571 RepID=A0ABR4PGT7_9HELO